MVILLRTSMTVEHTRTLLHTPRRLQFLPPQVPLPPRDHPGETVEMMIATGMAIAAVRIFHQVPLGYLHSAIHGHASFSGVFFSLLLSPSLGIPASLDPKNALDACYPYMEPDHNMMGTPQSSIKTLLSYQEE